MLLLTVLGASIPLSERAGQALLQLAARAAAADDRGVPTRAASADRGTLPGTYEVRLAEAIFGVGRR